MILRWIVGGVLSVGTLLSSEPDFVRESVPSLFMIADYCDDDLVHIEKAGESAAAVSAKVDQLASTRSIGGVIFKGKWTPTGLKQRISHLKSISKSPLLFVQDLEWGLSMRHFGAISLPKALCMGAIDDDVYLMKWADAIAKTAKEMGINCVLGPVADINTNPQNPIIHDRSFGDDPKMVAHKVSVVISRLQHNELIACAKHFPGHGDTSKDSHTHLPVVFATMQHIDDIELLPFKAAIAARVGCIMTAHIALPNAGSGMTPASLSELWVKKKIREELNFRGVMITDDLIMAGALSDRSLADTSVQAIAAGNDLCIVSREIESCFEAVEQAVRSGIISKGELEAHVSRVKSLYLPCVLTEHAPTIAEQCALSEELYTRALTLVGEPFIVDPQKTAVVQVGNIPLSPIVCDLASLYPEMPIAAIRRAPTKEELQGVLIQAHEKELLVILADTERSASCSFGITNELIEGMKELQASGVKIRYVIFGSPYILPLLPQPLLSALVVYERTPESERGVLRALRGEIVPSGRLPVKVFP